MRHRIVLLAAVALAGLACGNSREEKAIDEAEAACLALTQPGSTLRDASIALRGAYLSLVPIAPCDPIVPLQANDRCAPAQDDTACAAFWYFATSTICSAQGGCCGICEVRLLQSDLTQHGTGAMVCGSAFYRRQPCR